LEQLDALKLLNRQNSQSGRNQVVKKLPGGICVKCYAVSARILEVGDDGTLPDEEVRADDHDDGYDEKVLHMANAARKLRGR
jgi:hypothetical protein